MLSTLIPNSDLRTFIFSLLLPIFSGTPNSETVMHWDVVGQTAITVSPRIMCGYSSFPPPGLSVEWTVDTLNSEKYHLKATAPANIQIVRQMEQMVRFAVDRDRINFTLQLDTIQSTSQGDARLPVRLHINENVLQTMDNRPLILDLVPNLGDSGDSIVSHILWWSPLPNSPNYPDNYVVLVYNSTHVMQTDTKERQIVLYNLSPGTVYKMCVVHAHAICRGVEWSCLTRMLAIPLAELSPSPDAGVRHLSVLGADATSVQLVWSPPVRSTRTAHVGAPRFYLIILLPVHGPRSCSPQLFYVQAPWIHQTDYHLFTELVPTVLSKVLPETCSEKLPKPVQLHPMGVWPDWEKYDEQLDGWGRVSDFVVTVDHLSPLDEYSIHLAPIYTDGYGKITSARLLTTSLSSACDLKLESSNGKESRLIWLAPKHLLEEFNQLRSPTFQIDVERIGRPPLEPLREMCFVKSCTVGTADKLHFQPQSTGEAQRVLCQRLRVPLNPTHPEQTVSLPCLLPCQVYQISITLLVHSQEDPKKFFCQRRVVRPGQAPRPMSNLRATALSSDTLLVQLNKDQRISTHDYCAPIGYVISLFAGSPKLEVTSPLLLTLEDLARGLHLPLLSSSSDQNDSPYNLLLTHPLVNATKLHLTVESFATSISPSRKADVILQNLDRSCQMDCLWPAIPPYTLFRSIEEQSYHGQYASYRSLKTRRHQSFQCGRSFSSPREQMTRCVAPSGFILSDQAYCQTEVEFNHCVIPRCNEMALLTCVSNLQIPLANITELRFVWTAPKSTNSALWKPGPGDLPPPSGYVVTLSDTTISSDDASLSCVQSKLLLSDETSGLEAHRKSPFVEQLLNSCPSRGQSVVYRGHPEAIFSDLKQNTSYELRITAFDNKGLLGATWLHVVRTIPAAPCKPQSVFISRVESRALSLNWSLPSGKACGHPAGVLIHYHLHGRDQDRPEPLRLPPDTTTRLARLEPCQTYCMQVQFLNEVRAGPMSDKICLATRRPAFTRPPSVVLSLPRDSIAEAASNDFVTCQLDIQLDYTKTCPVQFQVEFGVYNSPVREQRLFHRTEIFISDRFHIGLFYQLRVRALSPDYVGMLGSFSASSPVSFHDSGWSVWLDLYTGMDQFKITNISIDVQLPTLAKDMALCVPRQPSTQSTEEWNSYVRRVILSDPDDLCIQVRWGIDGRTRGLVGLLLVVFGEHPPVRSALTRQLYNSTERTVNHCFRMLWVPCDNCLGPYSLKNAHQQVWNQLFHLAELCETAFHLQGDPSPDTLTLLTSPSPILNTNQISSTDALLRLLSRNTISRVTLNQSSVDLLLNVSRNMILSVTDPSTRSQQKSTHSAVRVPRQSTVRHGLRLAEVEQGILHFYMVSANNITLIAHQRWRLPSPTSAYTQLNTAAIAGLVFGVLFVLGLLAALSLLLVFNAKRVNRMRHSALQRTADYGGLSDFEDEDVTLRMEMKQPILPPKIAKFLMRPPDPISVHEFTLWYSKHSLNNYQSLRQEFKHLQIHAMRQEQAKRLTRQVGQRPENRLRNKYRNLVPFDHNYVHLLKPWRMVDIVGQSTTMNCSNAEELVTHGESEQENKSEAIVSESDGRLLTEEYWIASDYVNASLVPGRAPGIAYCLVQSNLLPRTYIAAQAPVEQTRVLFWQMIWDHGVKLVLTLTRLVEGPKEKCVQYWPGSADDSPPDTDSNDAKTLQLGHFTISLLECVTDAVVVKRKFSVENSLVTGGSARTVVQLHMLRWPDFSAPTPVDFTSLLFTYWTERRCTTNDAPVLIHCSAGIGRTGTFICLDQLCHQVRYYLQPDFQSWNTHPASKWLPNSEEPVYVNLKFDSEEAANLCPNNHRVSGTPEAEAEPCNDDYPNGGNQTATALLSSAGRANDMRSGTTRRRRFGLGRRKSHCIDIYKIVLWLRSNRSYMVQSEEQYLFIYQYLSYFIQTVNDSEQIYVNV